MKSAFGLCVWVILMSTMCLQTVWGLQCYECHYNSKIPGSPEDCLNPESNPTYLQECRPFEAGNPSFCHTSSHYLQIDHEINLYVDRSCLGGAIKQLGCVEFLHPEKLKPGERPFSELKHCTCATESCNNEVVDKPVTLGSCNTGSYRAIMDSIYLFTAAMAYRF